MTIPRLRMFAGPNGSGKSTLKGVVPANLLGVYLNPDEIQIDIARRGFLDCQDYQVATTGSDIISFFSASTLLRQADLAATPALRAAKLQAAEARLLAAQAVLPIYFYSSKHLVRPELRGFEANALDHHPSRFLSIAGIGR